MRFREFVSLQALNKKTLVVMASLFLLVASFAFLVHIKTQQLLLGYQIAESENKVRELEDRLHQLKLEREVLKRPERIEAKAHDLLRMHNGNL